ncbi:winged helix-turn-helix domain-containing protein [Kitasatospora sp. NPDC004289]
MRYAQGGGLSDERRAFREEIRRLAADAFVRGDDNAAIAKRLRVHVRSVQRWRQAWLRDGLRALASKGAASLPLLAEELFTEFELELARGAEAHGWPDSEWTLNRIRLLLEERFDACYTVQGVAALLKRHGWVRQAGARRVCEGGGLVSGWVKRP